MILQIRRGRAKHRQRVVTEPMYVVGTGHGCDMVLGDPQFSSVHFYLLSRDGRTTIRRVGSSPDITINGKVRDSAAIAEGDRIRTGSFEFVVKAA